MSLLERHLQMLRTRRRDQTSCWRLVFSRNSVEAELERIDWPHPVEIVLNPRFDLGSVLTVHTVAEALTRGGDVLLMDADVLYDERILNALVAGESVNRLLIDRDFEAGDEPVKLCLKDGVPVELRKQLAVNLEYDTIGESVASSASVRKPRNALRRSSRAMSTAAGPTCRTKKRCAICCWSAARFSTRPT